jgi:RimJ/RimL family protein N-acetyltransferase
VELPHELTIEGDGVLLRDWTEADAPAMRPVCGDPEVCRFTSVPQSYMPESALAWVRRQAERRAAGEGLALAITTGVEDAAPLGTVNLTRFEAGGGAALGFWLLPAARGAGLASRAAEALCRFGFTELGLARIELAILPENHASRRLAERLGARHEGLRRESHFDAGRFWDMEIYALESPCSR